MSVPRYVLDNIGIPTSRKYRQTKRTILKQVIKLVADDLLLGAAYTPKTDSGRGVLEILHDLEELNEKWSQKEWGK